MGFADHWSASRKRVPSRHRGQHTDVLHPAQNRQLFDRSLRIAFPQKGRLASAVSRHQFVCACRDRQSHAAFKPLEFRVRRALKHADLRNPHVLPRL